VVTLNAVPARGWRFDSWEGFVESKANPLHVQVTDDITLTATFLPTTNVYLPSVAHNHDGKLGSFAEACE
jgi:hypothetical protein